MPWENCEVIKYMYLTRMELIQKIWIPYAFRLTGKIHGLVESGFSGERKRNLWRLEYLGDRLYLLILSPDRPDLSIGVRRYGFPDDEKCLSDERLHTTSGTGKK